MAQWDGIGDNEALAEFRLGLRKKPRAGMLLDTSIEHDVAEWMVVISRIERKRAVRLAFEGAPQCLVNYEYDDKIYHDEPQ